MSCLNVQGGFDWNETNSATNVNYESDDISGEEEESTSSQKKSKSKKNKAAAALEKDSTLNFAKIGKFDASSPKFEELATVDECERLVLAYPNSSKAWLLYMVFHLKQAEVEKAKNVADKALKSISFREENEKLNIWISMLNIENLYGTQQSLSQIFQKALLYNEPKLIYSHMVELYMKSEKNKEAEEMFHMMVRKFKQDKEIWIKFMTFYMQTGKSDKAHKLINRCFQCLPTKFHPDIMAKLAHLEYKHGDMEKGRSMFENLLQNHSKRKDLVSVYISLLKNNGDTERAEFLSEHLKA